MKKHLLLITLVFSISIKAQNFVVLRCGYGAPTKELKNSAFDKNNFAIGLSLYKTIVKTKPFSLLFGFGYDMTFGRQHKYQLQYGELKVINSLHYLFSTTRLNCNSFKINPFIEYSSGILFSFPMENYMPYNQDINQDDKESHFANINQSTMISSIKIITTGLRYKLNDEVSLEISASYNFGEAIKYIDYNKTQVQGNKLYVDEVQKISKSEMYIIRVGIYAKMNTIVWTKPHFGGIRLGGGGSFSIGR